MKLRIKLLLGVGILLFAMVIMMYILPTFFVRKDVYKAAEQIHTLLIEDHRELIHSQQIWLKNALESTVKNIEAILFMLYEEPPFSKKLAFTENNTLVSVWNNAARVAGYDPDIGFIQVHAPEKDETVVISPHTGVFYPAARVSDNEDVFLVALKDESNESEQTLYMAIPLPNELQTQKGYTLYVLIDSPKIASKKATIQKEVSKIKPDLLALRLENVKQLIFSQVQGNLPSYFWAIKIDMIRALAPLIVEGFLLEKSEEKFIPQGIARLDSSGTGFALLAEDVFQTTTLFDDQSYYETHPPKPNSLPIAQGYVLVTKERGNHAFMANTLLIENTFFSIGVPFSNLVNQLALSSNKTILLQVKNQFWLGFDGKGNKVPQSRINEAIQSGLLNQQQGIIILDKKPFHYARISSLDDEELVFYEIHQMGREESIISTLLDLENQLSGRISLQLFLISLGTMILILFFIGRMGFSVIYPITKLAQATTDVVAGRFEDVVLPDVGKRRDEVAILTRSFGDMVHGLMEREKIRGVLDKVVSKDVADEILRTQIHLGGEDRIVTMLFSDIRGFTEITENSTPQKTIQLLNGCMTKVSRVIEGEGGVIDKYVGDEVMAIFGAPTTHPDHALRAVSTGMLIIETLKRWNLERAEAGEPIIEMGIGVHTGLVVAGNMGAEDRLNYTVLGSNVNLASRLCQVAKPNQLIISQATLAEPNVEESFFVKPLEAIVLKGFKEPVSIYQVVGFKWEES